MVDSENQEKRTAERQLVETDVIFHTEADIYMAKSVDISDAGIRIITNEPVDIRIQIKEDEKFVQYDAQLIWVKVKDDGSMEYGLKY
jgi:hypothetical protein